MSERKKWLVSDVRDAHTCEISKLSEQLSVSAVTASVLYNRGLTNVEDALRFIRKESVLFHNPYLMKDIDKGVACICDALKNGDRITIYGDYDVDGVTSVSTLYLYLRDRGAEVDYYIPNRNGEGYGINKNALKKLCEKGTRLIITVDTGITAVEETEYAYELGMKLIVTDHHECPPVLPPAEAVINPKRADCAYPFKELAGVGVVFKLICAVEQRLCEDKGEHGNEFLHDICKNYIDLVSIGTISDVMPLVDENRLIVSMGLHYMETTERPGLSALLDMVGSKDDRPKKKRKLTASYIGFVVAPKINAAGRLSSASIAVDLFLTDKTDDAKKIVENLLAVNAERQATESAILEDAYKKIAEDADFSKQSVIVLGGDGWHQGVIGIVASRITEYYNLPAILISFDDDMGKGSGRSVKGMNLVDALRDSEDLLVKFGGHALAAGLSIKRENLEQFRARINEYAKTHISSDAQDAYMEVDCEVYPDEFNLKLAEELYCLEPYGISNPVPVFVMKDVEISDICGIGQNKHTRLTFTTNKCTKLTALCFGVSPESVEASVGDRVDVVFNININEFQNQKTVQMIVKDMCFTEATLARKLRGERLYERMEQGEPLTQRECINCVPCRDDYKVLYRFLRKEAESGNTVFCDNYFETKHIGYPDKLSIIKIKAILRVFAEAGVISLEGIPSQYTLGEKYKIIISETDRKFNLENSELYRITEKYRV